MAKNIFWADQIAMEVKKRVERSSFLKKIVRKNGYIIYDEKTPSGEIHIGSGRGWVIHDVIAKAMRDIKLKARFILSSDDMDPYDKPNKDLPNSFNEYLGMPFRAIPSPVKGYSSFADYYFRQCTDKFKEFGIEAEIESTGKRYDKGDFNQVIKIILDNSEKVKQIFERVYNKPYGKLPFNPICEKCGKIGTTLAYEWDKEKELIKYRCMENLVKWAKGCGYEGSVNPYNGKGKLPWKVEWAAKWPVVGVVCELAGKDHFTPGGSRTIAIAISNEILDFSPPYPSTKTEIGKGYEFFTVRGKKMSTSKGYGASFVEITDYVPANILRYLLVRTRPQAVIDFDPTRMNDIILLYDRYDKTERIYYGKERLKNKDKEKKQRRIYELSFVGKIRKKMPEQISLMHAAMIAQIAKDSNEAIKILQKTRSLSKDLTKTDKEYVKSRLEFAKKWVDKFAPNEYKFELQEHVPKDLKITEKERKALHLVADILEKKELNEKELFEEFYNICKKISIEPRDFFKVAYKILINKERGPRLASFILVIGKEKVIDLLKRV